MDPSELLARATALLITANDIVWGWPTIVLLAGTGLWLTFTLRGLQFRQLIPAIRLVVGLDREEDDSTAEAEDGDISNFQALMTALSATVGTGNIAGVATAISIGGPGALFWMWVMGLIGMATKFSEALLAVEYRITDENGKMSGGPMYYLSRGLGWKSLGSFFAVCTVGASLLGIGNLVQSNTIAHALKTTFGVPEMWTAALLMLTIGLVLLGGIESIGRVAGLVVPTMIVVYVATTLVVLITHAAQLPAAIALVFEEAFTPTGASGGFAGAGVLMGLRMGVARGLFSNESGLGSAPIAAAAARTKHPVHQALFSMTQTFIDTVVICSMTGLALIVTDQWHSGRTGADLTSEAFGVAIPGGRAIVSLSLVLFAWTTMLGWSYYGEKSMEYLAGVRAIPPFRIAFVLCVGIGAIVGLDAVWMLGDILNALMAFPNLLALLALSPVIVRLTREYFERSRPPGQD